MQLVQHIWGWVDLKNESTPSSAFYELPAWIGINTRSQTAQCRQEKVSHLNRDDTIAGDNYLSLKIKVDILI